MNAKTIGNIIKELREDKGMTQMQLAERLNVSDKTVSKWETGGGYPDITQIEPLIKILIWNHFATKNVKEPDEAHLPTIEGIEDEYYITFNHPMTKDHYISFVAAVADNGVEIIKMYPEGNPELRVRRSRTRYIYFFCNKHGLFRYRIKKNNLLTRGF